MSFVYKKMQKLSADTSSFPLHESNILHGIFGVKSHPKRSSMPARMWEISRCVDRQHNISEVVVRFPRKKNNRTSILFNLQLKRRRKNNSTKIDIQCDRMRWTHPMRFCVGSHCTIPGFYFLELAVLIARVNQVCQLFLHHIQGLKMQGGNDDSFMSSKKLSISVDGEQIGPPPFHGKSLLR